MTRSNSYAAEQFLKCKAGKGSALRSSGDKLWSYGTVILQRLDDSSIVANDTKYSATTSKHQSLAGVKTYVGHKILTSVPRGASDLSPYMVD